MNTDSGDKTLRCIRCGFCLDACPTFRLTGNEADSPRGRVYLMRSVNEGTIPLDDAVRRHIDSCLGCRACETACPSGVQYASILEGFRAKIEQSGVRPGPARFARKQLLDTLTSPGRMAASMRASALLAKIGGPTETMPRPLSTLLTGSAEVPVRLPAMPKRVSIGCLPEHSSALGKRRFTVGVLAGCVMRVMFHATNEATVRVLTRNGCDVLAPRLAGCCGAFHLHSGYPDEAKSRARALLDALDGLLLGEAEIDAFVVNSAGCGSTLKEYGDLLATDPVYAERAAHFAAKVRDVSEWLMQIGIETPPNRLNTTVAYHDACHLAHGQGIRSAPRDILRSIPGVSLVELEEADTCCGSAGVYNMTQPQMAGRLLERKVNLIERSGANVVATGNPGCLAWIEQGLRGRGLDIAIRHSVEILNDAYGG